MQVVNLVSNDVRRFDEGLVYWVFLWAGPLELACVILMISVELGAAAAFAGIAMLLALIPLQVNTLSFNHTFSPVCNCKAVLFVSQDVGCWGLISS